jgi:hypothetical protein
MKGLKTWPNTYFERRRPVLDLNAAIRERHSTRMFLLQGAKFDVGWVGNEVDVHGCRRGVKWT